MTNLTERKRCPLRMIGSPGGPAGDWECIASRCEWWIGEEGVTAKCSVPVLAEAVEQLLWWTQQRESRKA